jgi:hypothetical protein
MAGGLLRVAAGGMCALAAGAIVAAARVPDGAALPDRDQFLGQISARLRSDQAILRNYAYTRIVEERERDESGRVTSTRRRVYEVRPLPDDPDGFRITLVRDNEPAGADAIARARAEYQTRVARIARERAQESATARERRLRREAESRREKEAILDDVRSVFEVSLVRREIMNGVP